MNTPVRSPANRWTSSIANLGQAPLRTLPESTRPSATEAVRSAKATSPPALAEYQVMLEARITRPRRSAPNGARPRS